MDQNAVEVVGAVRRFIDAEVKPHVARLERDAAYPENLVNMMKELGLFSMLVPEEYGGLGLSLPLFAQIMEEVAAGWTSLAAYLNSHSTVVYLLRKHGTPEQRERYLPRLGSGVDRGALCLTEAGAGSDLQSIDTSAQPIGGSFAIRGTKTFVTNGARASLYAVLVKTDPYAKPAKAGMSLMIVEKSTPGVSVGAVFRKMAYGLVDTVEVLFDNVAVPAEGILGAVTGRGLPQLLDGLEIGRVAIAASAVGLAASALGEAKRYATQRRAFGVTIDRHQAVQLRLADMATRLVAARLLTAEAARQKDTGARADMVCGMAKLFASEACLEIVSESLRIHGGYGYLNDCAIERLYREAPLYIVGEGTNDIQKLLVAKRLLDGADHEFLGIPA
jgi:alkylation response protein AidB-like acyl-CoA dehydrogenase